KKYIYEDDSLDSEREYSSESEGDESDETDSNFSDEFFKSIHYEGDTSISGSDSEYDYDYDYDYYEYEYDYDYDYDSDNSTASEKSKFEEKDIVIDRDAVKNSDHLTFEYIKFDDEDDYDDFQEGETNP